MTWLFAGSCFLSCSLPTEQSMAGIRKTFPTLVEARARRAETQTGVRRGTLRAPARTTVREAAKELVAGMKSGRFTGRSRLEARRVQRLAYTRTHAAAALGVSRSTFDRRVLPLVQTIQMPWGTRLIPVDELKRLIAEQRRPAAAPARPAKRGRPRALSPNSSTTFDPSVWPDEASARSQVTSFDRRVATAHGGVRWWPSTIREILARCSQPNERRKAQRGRLQPRGAEDGPGSASARARCRLGCGSAVG